MAVALTVSMADDMLTFCVFYDLFIGGPGHGGGSYCVYGGRYFTVLFLQSVYWEP